MAESGSSHETPTLVVSLIYEDKAEWVGWTPSGLYDIQKPLYAFLLRRDALPSDFVSGPRSGMVDRMLQAELMRDGRLHPITFPLSAYGHPGAGEGPFLVPIPWPNLDRMVALIRRHYPDAIFRVWERRCDVIESDSTKESAK